jgi:hypothetical protein
MMLHDEIGMMTSDGCAARWRCLPGGVGFARWRPGMAPRQADGAAPSSGSGAAQDEARGTGSAGRGTGHGRRRRAVLRLCAGLEHAARGEAAFIGAQPDASQARTPIPWRRRRYRPRRPGQWPLAHMGSAWAAARPATGGGRLGRAFGLGPVR